MTINLDTDTAQRIREVLSDAHDEAYSEGNTEYAREIDALCGILQAGEGEKRHEAVTGSLHTDSPENREYTLPVGERCWITVGSASILVNGEGEGVVIDIFAAGAEDGESVASTYALYQELADDEGAA